MKSTSRLCVGAIVALGAVVLGGCDKKVTLTFVNATPEIRQVEVAVPGQGNSYVGTVNQGERVRKTIKINTDDLPAEVQWRAGDLGGRFMVDDRTQGKLLIPIDKRGNVGPIDKNTEVQTHVEEETTHQETHEVVE